MRALERKLLRDAWRLKGQVVSIALVVAVGVTSVVSMRSTLYSLESARDAYYRNQRFADVFASVTRAPEALARRIEQIPGVAFAETRVVRGAVLSVPGLPVTATGVIVSVPEVRTPMLNDLVIRSGRYVEAAAPDEVILSERFARVNALAPGDTLGAIVNGSWRTLRVVGTALSPEYVYEIDPSGGFLTDERLFGVMWMGRGGLEAAAGMTGAFTDVSLSLAPGASSRAVEAELDDLLEPYGGRGAYPRAEQISNRLLSDEMQQLRGTASVVPVIFLCVAAFLLHIVLLRLVATERGHIGTLKAFGYTDVEVGAHYLMFAFFAVALGAALGLAGGLWAGSAYTRLYRQFFYFPDLSHHMSWGLALGAITVSAAAASAGALSAVRRAVRLQPAEAMIAESPTRFRRTLLERWGLDRWVGPSTRMMLRNVERRPVRSGLASVGIGFALAVLLIGLVMLDSMRTMIQRQFTEIQREDIAVGLGRTTSSTAVEELARIPGVWLAEGYHSVPVRLAHGHRSYRLALTGLSGDGTLRRLTDAEGREHDLPQSGLVLTDRLGRMLDVRPGDTLSVELLERPGRESRLVVAALIDEMLGVNGYMATSELEQLADVGPRVSGAWLAVARGTEPDVLERLRVLPGVTSTVSKSAMLASFEDQLAKSVRVTTGILLALAGVLAVGIVYNGARVALSERQRDLASLRVLGFTRGEVAVMLLGEQGILTALGLPIGVLLGYGAAGLIMRAYETELYRMPMVFEWSTVLSASAAVALLAASAGLLVRRQLDGIDLVAVLKTKE